MDVAVLWELIALEPQVTQALKKQASAVQLHREEIQKLTNPETAEAACRTLSEALEGSDMAMLACQLEAAACTYDRFLGKGVSAEVLVDTLKCFSRFLRETHAMTGQWKFDREWWTWRQVSGLLFRVGELEYEMLPQTGEISLHIPSDAVFTPENVDASLAAARAFFAEHFPTYRDADYVCHSWLMSPKLKELLPESSNIVSFQNRFRITHVDPDNREYIHWLFAAMPDTPLEALPEKSSLQRKTKELMRVGGHIGEAGGILR